MPSRELVYEALDAERDYQEQRWNYSTTSTGGKHSVTEFVLYMDTYIQDIKQDLSKNADPEASRLALDKLRKVTAMGIACMEQNGIVKRE